MTSPRLRDIKNVKGIRVILTVLFVFIFWVPWGYFWVWMLEPLEIALCYALIIGGVSGLCLLPLWNKYEARLTRLLKYNTLFDNFFEAMITDMERNDAEKGNTWLTMDVEELRIMQNKKYLADIGGPTSKEVAPINQVKLSNYSAMIYLRSKLG